MGGTTILVAYFSRTGENYSVSTIENGNTHIVANMIAEQTDGDMFAISTVKPDSPKYIISIRGVGYKFDSGI